MSLDSFPFTDKVRAEEAAASLRRYGESLFEQVFRRQPDVYAEYQRLRQADILLEVVGSPEFHALHWEALHDPNQERPLAVNTPLVRKHLQPVPYRAQVQPAPHLRVLLVTARPAGPRDVSYRTISRPLVEALETGRVAAQVDIVRPGTFEALVKHLEDTRDEHGDGYYHIIHLDMHGALLTYPQYQHLAENKPPQAHLFQGSGYGQEEVKPYEGRRAFLFFDEAAGRAEGGGNPVSADDLARLLNLRQVPLAVLNACQSGKQVGAAETSLGSRLIAAGVQLVVAMGYSVTVSAARLLMTHLYQQLLEGRPPAVAIRRARLELYHNPRRRAAYGQEIRLADWVLPVIYQNQPVSFDAAAFQGGPAAAALAYRPPHTSYGFVGRDLDILQLERHLLQRRNLLLLRGMGGAGKTTLLHHLGWWWQKTRLVERVFYFGYDVKAYHLAEIISRIGQELGLNLTGIAATDRAQVVRALKSRRHLLLLDNLESITGERLAVQHTLPPAAQAELRDFLAELVGGRSLVLLGSRGGESWLRPDPLRDLDVYDLPGLDYESQTALAEAILQTRGAPHYPSQPAHQADFQRLLALLGGYPLALEVVLANLAQATPREVLERLEAADVALDRAGGQGSRGAGEQGGDPSTGSGRGPSINSGRGAGESAEEVIRRKTESILKCIEYSHSNLSAEAQALLLCLAPFTGVINTNLLAQYTARLQAQPALADLPYDQWSVVLQEATNWGLLQPHEQWGQACYLRLQPIFPYFLKTRLYDPAQAVRQQAVEQAFREHYEGIGEALAQLAASKKAEEQGLGYTLIGVEYENLLAALTLSLKQFGSILNIYRPISSYFDRIQNHQQGLELDNLVLAQLEDYPAERLQGQMAFEFGAIIDNVANRRRLLKQYLAAEAVYKRGLQLVDTLTSFSDQQRARLRASTLHQLGVVAEEQRQWAQAEGYYKEALQILTDFNDRYAQASTLHQLGVVAEAQQQWAQAEGYYKEALQILTDFNDRYAQASAMHNLGVVAGEQQQWAQAEGYYKKALQIKIDFNDRYSQAMTLHQLGVVAGKQRQWAQAEGYYKKALQILIDFNDHYSQAKTLHQLGVVAGTQRQWAQAESYYKEALQIHLDFNNRYSQAETLHNLGVVAGEQRQWAQAEGYYKEALQIKIDFNDRYSQATTLHQLGVVAGKQRQWAQAEGYYRETLQIYLDFNDRYSQAKTLHNLGVVAQEQRQWEQAEGYYKEALQIYLDFNDRYSQAKTLHNLGEVAGEQRQWVQAEDYYNEVLQIYLDFNDRYLQAETLHQLGVVAQAKQQWAQAEDYYREALQIKIDFNDRYAQAFTLHQLGRMAGEQRQWTQAKGYFKEALQIKVDFNDRYSQAATLHQLGIVAQEQRQWVQAEGYYKEALQILIDFSDRYSQAATLHHLGVVAGEQRQWVQAEDYYKKALQIFIALNERYAQALTWGQLGLLAEAQSQWEQVSDYSLQAAAIFAAYKDPQLAIALRSLARLWQAGGPADLAARLAAVLGLSPAEAEALLAQFGAEAG